ITKPYFRVARLDPSSDGCLFDPLEADRDFNITHAALKQFELLVRRFLVNGSGKPRQMSGAHSTDSPQQQIYLDLRLHLTSVTPSILSEARMSIVKSKFSSWGHDPGVSRRSKGLIRRPESNSIGCRRAQMRE